MKTINQLKYYKGHQDLDIKSPVRLLAKQKHSVALISRNVIAFVKVIID